MTVVPYVNQLDNAPLLFCMRRATTHLDWHWAVSVLWNSGQPAPDNASGNGPDVVFRHAAGLGDLGLSEIGLGKKFGDFNDGAFSKFAFAVLAAKRGFAVLAPVLHVLFMSAVFEIAGAVVGFDPINMADLHLVRPWPQKSKRNQFVNANFFAIDPCAVIAAFVNGFCKNCKVAAGALYGYLAIVTDLVLAIKSGDRFPRVGHAFYYTGAHLVNARGISCQ